VTLKAVALLVAVLACFGAGYYLRGLQCKVGDETAVIKQVAQNQKTLSTDQTITSEESKTYANAVAQAISAPDPAPAVVCVRQYAAPRPLSQAAATPAAADAGDRLPTGAPGPLPGPTDIGGPATASGARANAQVAGLKDYITRVCLAP